MFKSFPDVVVTQECGNGVDTNYSINWEEIARWALENDTDNMGGGPLPVTTVGQNSGSHIDWCEIAAAVMRDATPEDASEICDANEINASIRALDRPILCSDSQYPSESMSRLAANGYEEFHSPIEYRERMRTPEPIRRRRRPEKQCSFIGNSDFNRSIRDSDFNNTSCYDRTPLSPIKDFSCMEDLHDSTEDYQSDIMSYLEDRAERNRPHSIAEGYHFPGRAYGTAADNDCRMFTSTPKKNHRTTRAETFELADGSKMFNVTFEEALDFGRRLRHVSDVRDPNGCQVMHIDREIDEDENGGKHRVDIARRWLNFDDDNAGGGAGCS